MRDKIIYEYAIIRIVPKVERGEYLNVGVILFSKRENYLAMKYHIDTHRLKSFSEAIDLENLSDYLKAWDLVCNGHESGGPIGQLDTPVRFRWLTASRSTIIQSSRVHPGLCDDLEKLLEDLHLKYVL